jgi:hypothetical protein
LLIAMVDEAGLPVSTISMRAHCALFCATGAGRGGGRGALSDQMHRPLRAVS